MEPKDCNWCYVCGAMGYVELDKKLKQEGQQAFEELHGHGKFMEEFGKNFIENQEQIPANGEEQQEVGFWFLE